MIEGGITSIGENTFYGYDSLEYITIFNSVTSISDYAFGNCNNLRTISCFVEIMMIMMILQCFRTNNVTFTDRKSVV